ncbi:MAG: prepilin peptidase [Candidatus Parcubacteria bacterium]|nr:prepilin peptidase [Candidatus Parcubacteria bacterium]
MLVEIFVFILGTIIGSFLNVVILRYNTGESIVKNRSRCFSCGKKLNWYELIPVLSFIIQKGRCRNCKNKISIQYPTIEIITGLLFLLIFNLQFSVFKLFYFWAVFSVLIIIAVYDLKHQIIPDMFVYLFGILAFLNLFGIWNLKIGIFKTWDFLAGIIFFVFFGLIWLVSKGNWMGLGDAKLSLGIGWLLGLFKGILALLFSFWTGALVGIFLLFFFKKEYNLKSRIPFGPFLIWGIIIAFFFGDAIIKLAI